MALRVDGELIDHHCHGLVQRDLDRPEFESMLTEADTPGPPGTTLFDSQLGFALRRWCAPQLDLPPHAEPDTYLERRAELGHEEVHRRLLTAAGITTFCVDTGFQPEPLTSSAQLAAYATPPAATPPTATPPTATPTGAATSATSPLPACGLDVMRLERIAELAAVDVLTGQIGVGHLADTVRARLADRSSTTVAVKSVAAYRAGLELPAVRPTEREIAAATRTWINEIRGGAPIRLHDPVLHAFLIWCGVDAGLPVQIHVGYGDNDLDLTRGNPLLLTGLLRAIAPSEVSVLLLHCYPYHREAAYLAQVFPNVHLDLGLAIHNTGRGSAALLAQALELAPFAKLLFSTDAYALAELFLLGATLFRRGLASFLDAGVADDAWTPDDATRITQLISAGNARRVYRLPAPPQPAGFPTRPSPARAARSQTARSETGRSQTGRSQTGRSQTAEESARTASPPPHIAARI
ncbi:amidohydrolase family protein [Frankia sp. Ag45/Mut15]|uniref:Amidohydrolase family protein n=1 Tax=Frankia umida TaxID=573489 RepID=A0ABT0JWA9_9ACTN|nr:amidohydrolase family protein [Frankia umida]MCK9875604.1 amidohydrolase family protein [Frankia umida]